MHKHTQKLILRILSFTLILLSAAFSPAASALAAPSQGEPTGFVNTGRLNVRTGPWHTYDIVVVIDRGQGFTLLGRNTPANWVQIKLPSGITGWVKAAYIKTDAVIGNLPVTGDAAPPPTTATATVNTGRLNVRSAADPYATIVTTVDKGASLTLVGRNQASTWAQVKTADGKAGWVRASFLKLNVSLSSLPVTSP